MSDPDDQKLQRILDLSESSNSILRSIKRAMWLGRVMHVLYWLVIIGVSIGAFWYLKPYINQIEQLYSGLKSGVNSTNSFNSDSLSSIFNNLGR
ncbi:MAG TPA: hypothetical protein VJJ27_01925 [Candidatus Paceibacterota bacterium]